MKPCPNCGASNQDDAAACACGHVFESPPMEAAAPAAAPQPVSPATASSKRAVSIATIIVAAVAVLGFACSQMSLCATKKSIRETSQYSGGLLGEYNQTMKTASLRANVFSWAWLVSLGGLAAFLQFQRKRKLAGVKTLPMSAAASAGAVVFLILVYVLLMILT